MSCGECLAGIDLRELSCGDCLAENTLQRTSRGMRLAESYLAENVLRGLAYRERPAGNVPRGMSRGVLSLDPQPDSEEMRMLRKDEFVFSPWPQPDSEEM